MRKLLPVILTLSFIAFNVSWFVFITFLASLLIYLVIFWKKKQWYRYVMIIVLIVGICSITTYISWKFVSDQLNVQVMTYFENQIQDIENEIIDRLEIYKFALVSGKGLFVINGIVEENIWQDYVKSINLSSNYPGIQGIGFAQIFTPKTKEAFIKSIRKKGDEDFNFFPEGDRDIYSAITMLEPRNERNQRALGYDMYSELVRREAMDKAIDTGQLVMSGKVRLIQEIENNDVQPGFLMFLPYYKDEAQLTSVKDRRSSIIGYIYSPFRMHDFINGILGEKYGLIGLSIYDGEEVLGEDQLMYDRQVEAVDAPTELITKTNVVNIFNHPWTFRFTMRGGQNLNQLESMMPKMVLVIGTAFTALFVSLFLVIVRRQEKTEKQAERLLKDLFFEKTQDEAIFSSIADGVIVLDEKKDLIIINESAKQMLNIDQDTAVTQLCDQIWKLRNADNTQVLVRDNPVELAFKGDKIFNHDLSLEIKGRQVLPISISASPVKMNHRIVGVVLVFRDRTIEKEYEESLTKRKDELERLNRLMVGRELKMRELKTRIKELEK